MLPCLEAGRSKEAGLLCLGRRIVLVTVPVILLVLSVVGIILVSVSQIRGVVLVVESKATYLEVCPHSRQGTRGARPQA